MVGNPYKLKGEQLARITRAYNEVSLLCATFSHEYNEELWERLEMLLKDLEHVLGK